MNIFTKKIFDSSPKIFGLDLSDLSIKVVQFDVSGKEDKVESYGKHPIPIGSVVDGEIVKKENVVAAIREVIRSASPKKIRTKKVICSLPETKAFLRIIAIPKMEEDEVGEAIKWEIEANIPLALDQVYYDWQILDQGAVNKGKINVLVVAVSKKTVDQFVDVLESSGLEVYGLEIESIAQSRSLIAETKECPTTFIIDCGDRRTSFLIAIGSVPCFTSSIPISSQSMTDAIMKSFNVSFDEAEKIKIANGIGSMMEDDLVYRAVRPVLENLVAEIKKTMDFYLNDLRFSSTIERIVMCGGGANTRGIVPYLSKKLNTKIELGNPWINTRLGKKLPIIERRESVQYTTAIGLALRGLRYDIY